MPGQPGTTPQQKADSTSAGTASAKKKADFGRGAFIGAAGVIYFVWRLAHHDPINGWDMLFTFGALSLGTWLILASVAVGGLVVFGWVALVAAWLGVGLSAVQGVLTGTIAPMTFPDTVLFIHAPTASLTGVCTSAPAAWALHGGHPSECARIAFSRLALAALSVVVLAAMGALTKAVKK